MSGWVVGLIMAAIGLGGYGMHLLSMQHHKFPIDVRKPGPLIEVRRNKPDVVHAAELRRMVSVMSYVIIGDPSAGNELQQAFDDLDAPLSPLVVTSESRRGNQRRSEQIDLAILALEERWGLLEDSPQAER